MTGSLYITETAAASGDTAGLGQIWVKNATPNELWFTDDAGTDVQLGTAGAGDISDVGPGYASGAAFTDGVVSTGSTALVWEGTSDDAHEWRMNVPEDPAADYIISWPSQSISFSDGFNPDGAVDIDYGSEDITDHTFVTDGTGDGEIVLPDESIGTLEIVDATILVGDMAANSIDSDQYVDESVDIAHLGVDVTGFLSPGILTGGAISEGTNAGTYKIAALTAALRDEDAVNGTMVYQTLSEQDNQSITAADTTYIVTLTEDGDANPTVSLTTSNPFLASKDAIPIGRVMKDGSDNVHYISGGFNFDNAAAHGHLRDRELDGLVLATGQTIAYTGTNQFTMTQGSGWGGWNRFSLASYDSSSTNFTPVYSDGGAGFTEGGATGTLDYTHYDDGDGTLGTVSNNKYCTFWVFRHVDDGDVYVRYGTVNDTLAVAELEQIPTLPAHLSAFGVLIGKIVMPQAGGSFTDVQMAHDTIFVGTAVSDHGNLSGLGDDDHTQYLELDGTDVMTGSLTIGDNSDVDYSITFDGDTSDGVLNYDEDNADFEFDQDVTSTGTMTASEFSGGGASLTAVDAATGDSATAFFDAGTIEHEWGGLQADVSAYTGLIGITGADTTVEVDTFSELDTAIADKTLVNEEDAVTWDALGTFSLGITITTGDPLTLGAVRWDDGSDKIDGEQLADNTVDADSLDWGAFTDLGESGAVTWGNITAGELANDTVLFEDLDDDGNYGPWTGVWDWTGGTVELPNGANPTTDAAGRIAIDSDDNFIEFYGSESRAVPTVYTWTKTLAFPDLLQAEADAQPLWFFPAEAYPHGITVTDIHYHASASQSDTHVLEEWTHANPPAHSSDIESIAFSASTIAEDDGTLSDGAIAADGWVFIDLDASVEDMSWLTVSMTFKVNPGD